MTLPRRWQDWTSFAAGMWLVLSPWIANYDDHAAATANAVFAGLALTLAAHFEASCGEDSCEWLNVAIGTWLLAAPWALGFAGQPVAATNSILVGVLAAALAASTLELDKTLSKHLHSR